MTPNADYGSVCPRWVTLPVAARFLDMTYQTAHRYASTGALVTDPQGRTLVPVVRVGGIWKVPVADLTAMAGLDTAAMLEWLQTSDALSYGHSRGKPAPSPRNIEMVSEYRSGRTMQELADSYGISRQRVQQIIAAVDDEATAERRQRRQEERHAATAVRAAADLARDTKLCRVCGEWFVTTGRNRTCSEACGQAWKLGRRYFDRSYYDRMRGYQGASGKPNRRFVVPDSAVVRALRAVGRTDVLPAAPPDRPMLPCSAVNLDGTPCRRSVHDAELCHIHARSRAYATRSRKAI